MRVDEVQRGKPQNVSVVIASWCRPDYVRSCLAHLTELTRRPDEVIVVDASPDDGTAAVPQSEPLPAERAMEFRAKSPKA